MPGACSLDGAGLGTDADGRGGLEAAPLLGVGSLGELLGGAPPLLGVALPGEDVSPVARATLGGVGVAGVLSSGMVTVLRLALRLRSFLLVRLVDFFVRLVDFFLPAFFVGASDGIPGGPVSNLSLMWSRCVVSSSR